MPVALEASTPMRGCVNRAKWPKRFQKTLRIFSYFLIILSFKIISNEKYFDLVSIPFRNLSQRCKIQEKLSQNWPVENSTRGEASAENNNKVEKPTNNAKKIFIKGKSKEIYVKMRRFVNYKQYFRSQKLEIIHENRELEMSRPNQNFPKRFPNGSQNGASKNGGYGGAKPRTGRQVVGDDTIFVTFFATAIDAPGDEGKKRDQPHPNYLDKYVHTKSGLNLPRTAVTRTFTPQTEFGTEPDERGGVKRVRHLLKKWKCTYGYNQNLDMDHLETFDGKEVEVGNHPYKWVFKLQLRGVERDDELQKWIIVGKSVNWVEDIDHRGVSAELTRIVKQETGMTLIGKFQNLKNVKKTIKNKISKIPGKVKMHQSGKAVNRGVYTGDFFFKTKKLKEAKDAQGRPEKLKIDIMKKGWDKPRTMIYHQVLPIKRCEKCQMTSHDTADCDFEFLKIDDAEYDVHAKPIEKETYAENAARRQRMSLFYDKALKNHELMKVRNAIAGNVFAIRDLADELIENLGKTGVNASEKNKLAKTMAEAAGKQIKRMVEILHLEDIGAEQQLKLSKASIAKDGKPPEGNMESLVVTNKTLIKLIIPVEEDPENYVINWDYALSNTITAPHATAPPGKGGKLRTTAIALHTPASLKENGLADINIIASVVSGSHVDYIASRLDEVLLQYLVDEICEKRPDPGRDALDGSTGIGKVLATELVVFLIVRAFKEEKYRNAKYDFTGLRRGDGLTWGDNGWA